MKGINTYIDVHHHYNPLSLLSLNNKMKQKVTYEEVWDLSRSLDMMEKYGIQKSLLSYPASFASLPENDKTTLCTKINECYAELSVKHTCLGAFASLPISTNQEVALREMEHALDVLHLDGILLPTNFSGIYPGSGLYHELYNELNRRNAIVFLHPNTYFSKGEQTDIDAYALMAEVTRAACELVFNKVIHRYPNIRFILSYGGGNVSFFFQRIKQGTLYPDLSNSCREKDLPHGIEYYLKQFYYDTAFPVQANLLNCLKAFVNRSQILYGSDFPSSSQISIGQNMDSLRYSQYKDKTLADCCRENSSFLTGQRL